ncbi:MAG: glycosyltransferase family 4 protein [Sedimentisphaerales bacterium]|nr:glycosyltransferase family 4 protein [Sedimentisphaerales bacterium]
MRIIQITPSAGDSFYCENCLRDATLVKTLIALGHDVLMVPLYLPLSIEQDKPGTIAPIFFGGVNVYLQQKLSLFRKTPRWFDKWFDSPGLLKWVGRMAGMTSAKDLGETTISMLQGEEGQQIKELNRLVDWLVAQDNKPDVICLSNVLLLGLARRIKQKLGVPVVCLLQDEEGFLDGLPSPYAEQAWKIIIERAGDVNAFIAVSQYYADVMRQRLNLEPDRVKVAYTGIALDGYGLLRARPNVPTIGYLSQMCPDKGLDTLVEAFIRLKMNKELSNIRLRVTGGSSAGDKTFLNKIRQKLNSHGLLDDVEFLEQFDLKAKLDFLQTISVLSVPEKNPVACGLYVLEALAAGIPVVQPAHGVFPELLEITGGGLLYEPNNVKALAGALEPLLLKMEHAQQLGEQGRKAVHEKFNIEQTTRDLMRIYEELIDY